MNFQLQYGPGDEASRADGDAFFIGVNERLAPLQLPPGVCSSAKNKRFRNGKAEDRHGICLLPWLKGAGNTAFSNAYGVSVFHDPNQPAERIMLAADGAVYQTQPNNTARTVPLPGGVTLTADTWKQFVQAMGVLLMLRGPDTAPLYLRDIDDGFHSVVQTDTGDGTQPIPNSSRGIYYGNRVYLIVGRDLVAQSDLGDFTRYVEVEDTFTINEGEDDALVGIVPFGAASLVMPKQRRVWKVINAKGDLSAAEGPLNLTTEYGCPSGDAMVAFDQVLYWWTGTELAAARLTETNQEQAQTTSLSEDLPKTFARLNARWTANTKLAVWRKKLYVFFPADDAWILGSELVSGSYTAPGTKLFNVTAGHKYRVTFGSAESTMDNGGSNYLNTRVFVAETTFVTFHGTPSGVITASLKEILFEGVPNVCAVFDLILQQWCGVDESTALNVKALFKCTWNGKEQLCFLGYDGRLHGYEVGFEDEYWTGSAIAPMPIVSEVLTRGYNCQDAHTKRFIGMTALLATWAPSYTMTAVVNGVAAEKDYISAQTYSRLKYNNAATADWDPSNVNNDHGTRGRQDYSFVLDDANAGTLLDNAGINGDLHQDWTHRVPVDERGHYQQLRLVNTTGRCELRSVLLEAIGRDKPSGTQL